MIGVIYALSVVDGGFRYVGQTLRVPKRRLWIHRTEANAGSHYPLYQWMREHGPRNVALTVLCHAERAELDAAERWWIAELRGLGHNLLNLTDGGHGSFGRAVSDQTRRKISEGNVGPPAGRVYGPLSDEQKLKMSVSLREFNRKRREAEQWR